MKKFLALISVFALTLLAACGGGQDGAENTDELEGSVMIDGSGTVYPLMATIGEEYMVNEQPYVSVEVSRSGTSAGFSKFLAEDGTDFNDASRQIKDEEKATAEELGIEIAEFKVALDGLTFVIHPDNDWATQLTKEEIINIFKHDGGIEKWSDIRPEFHGDIFKRICV